jgi:hypothetical protein
MTKSFTKSTLMILTSTMIFFMFGIHGDGDKSFFEVLQEKLSQYNRLFYNERAYLVTDRFVYRPGEDIWFQGFVSSLIIPRIDSGSADFYVKFLNSKGEEIVSRRYPLYENQVSGRFLVPRTSIPGKYYLVAYTGWMKNQSPEEAFRKEILVGKYFDKRFRADIFYDKIFYYAEDSMNASIRLIEPSGKPVALTEFDYVLGSFSKSMIRGSGKTDDQGLYRLKCKIPLTDDIILLTIDLRSRRISGEYSMIIPAATSAPEVTFRSEDGNIVVGLNHLMAFSCKDHYGMPVSIEGEILDSEGHILQAVNSNARGLGSFNYQPLKDTSFLRITKPAGIVRRYPLPLASESGTILHLKKLDADTAWFTTISSGHFPDTVQYWVALINRQVVWKKKVPFSGKGTVNIPVADLPRGIMQVTVFNDEKQPVADRLLYLATNSNVLRIKTDRQIYHNRQRVVLSVDYLGKSNKVNLAMSVSLRQLAYSPLNMNFEEIISSFPYDSLSTRSGPGPYPSDLDLLISDYHQVNWPDILKGNPELKPYRRQDGLGGIIADKRENPAQHAKVRVTHIPNYRFYETQTNENGIFQVMFGSDIVDFNYLNVEAYDALGKVNLFASVDQNYSVELRKSVELKEENRDLQKIINTLSYDDPNVVYSLRYGPRIFRKRENEAGRRYDPKMYADYTSALDIIQEIKPFQIRNNRIVFPDTLRPAYVQEGVIIVINGVLKSTQIDILRNLLPSDVTNINISTTPADVHRYTPINFQGVIEITTIQGMFRYRQPTVQLGMDILNTSREFYLPDYSLESPTNSDNRKTLYWNPQVTITQGHSALISFYTSDIRGIYYGVLEGMDAEGNPIRKEFTIVVE